MKFREVEKKLLADGWHQVSQKGSHHQYKHPTKPGKVTVPETRWRPKHGYRKINNASGWNIISSQTYYK